jgi:type IX secretion system PorP/SprF family membrane protein
MKKKLLVFALMVSGLLSYGQQDSQFTQYMYNTVNINPAYAGSRGVMSIFALHRAQWVGLNGAPVTNALSINTPLSRSNVGLGISIINDKIAATQENTFSTDLSYTITTSESFKLSFGIKGTANIFNVDASQLNPVDPNDDSLQNYNKFTPNVGAGVYFYSDKAYVGFSVPNFIESERYSDNEVAILKEKINYYLMAGYVFELNDVIKFKPAMLTKVVQGAPIQMDISGNIMFMNKFSIGVAYRLNAAISALAGFQVTNGLFIGYVYEYETTNLRNFSSGSHEIFLRYEIFNNNQIITPRLF